jgi:hypothetical protein
MNDRRYTDEDDAFELIWSNETVLVRVQVLEGLSETFALQTLHQLGKLVVYPDLGKLGLSALGKELSYI